MNPLFAPSPPSFFRRRKLNIGNAQIDHIFEEEKTKKVPRKHYLCVITQCDKHRRLPYKNLIRNISEMYANHATQQQQHLFVQEPRKYNDPRTTLFLIAIPEKIHLNLLQCCGRHTVAKNITIKAGKSFKSQHKKMGKWELQKNIRIFQFFQWA